MDDIIRIMKSEGVTVTDEPLVLSPGGSTLAFIEDPDGILIELMKRK